MKKFLVLMNDILLFNTTLNSNLHSLMLMNKTKKEC